MKSHGVTIEKNLVTSTFTCYTIYLVLVLNFECVDAILWCYHPENLFSSTFTWYYLFSMYF